MLPYFFVFFGALLRLIPHPANFAPIAAVALFGGVYLKKRDAFWVPLCALILSDIFLGFDSWISRATVYGSFMMVGLLGVWLRRRKTVYTVVGASLLGSVIFYLVTNFALFYPPVMYPHNLEGIVSSYTNALPFFRNTLLGDLFFVSALFGLYELVRIRQEQRLAAAPASTSEGQFGANAP